MHYAVYDLERDENDALNDDGVPTAVIAENPDRELRWFPASAFEDDGVFILRRQTLRARVQDIDEIVRRAKETTRRERDEHIRESTLDRVVFRPEIELTRPRDAPRAQRGNNPRPGEPLT